MKADLHIHSTYSDGTNTIPELAQKIANAELEIIALTDHDTTDGLDELRNHLPENINMINGIELTCLTQDIKCHILGYFINPNAPELKELIAKGRQLRQKKLEIRIKYLKEKKGIELTQAEMEYLKSLNIVVKTHLAKILVNRGLAKTNEEAVANYLDCPTGNTRFDGEEAIAVIKKAGGIAVWAHPLGGEGETHISEQKLLNQLEIMKRIGIQGLECHYSRYSKDEADFLVNTAKENGLFITGGSDYHGENKADITLGSLSSENRIVDSSELTLLNTLLKTV